MTSKKLITISLISIIILSVAFKANAQVRFPRNQPVAPAPAAPAPVKLVPVAPAPENPAPVATQPVIIDTTLGAENKNTETSSHETFMFRDHKLFEYILKFGYYALSNSKPIAKQYTGNTAFDDEKNAGYFKSIKAGIVKDFDISFLKSIGLGAEYFEYGQNMKSMFPNGDERTGTPSIKYDLTVAMLALDFYFFNYFYRGNPPFKVYLGVGYGLADGKIEEDSSNPSFSSNMSGFYGYREAGFLVVGDYVGLDMGIRLNNQGSVEAEKDHFNQKKPGDSKLKLDFHGVTAHLGIVIRI